ARQPRAPAHDTGTAAEAAPPEPVAQDDDARSARALVPGLEAAARARRGPEQREEVRGHEADAQLLGLAVARELRPRGPDRREALEGPCPLAQVDELRAGERSAAIARLVEGPPDPHQPSHIA